MVVVELKTIYVIGSLGPEDAFGSDTQLDVAVHNWQDRLFTWLAK